MTNRPSVPEIITVNSETLQTQIRDLLPSQNGFGSELQASNVITPIIDLTAAAEGSTVSESLQQALAFGSQTAHAVNNTTTTIINQTGFFRIFGAWTYNDNDSAVVAQIILNDGSTDKVIWGATPYGSGGASANQALQVDFIVFCAAGESVKINATGNFTNFVGSSRQIATGSGTLVNPNGFPL